MTKICAKDDFYIFIPSYLESLTFALWISNLLH